MNNVFSRLSHYLPPLFFFLCAYIVLRFPYIAAFFVAGVFVIIGLMYAALVSKVHQARKMQNEFFNPSQSSQNTRSGARSSRLWDDLSKQGEPGLKNVTIAMVKRGKSFYREDQQR